MRIISVPMYLYIIIIIICSYNEFLLSFLARVFEINIIIIKFLAILSSWGSKPQKAVRISAF